MLEINSKAPDFCLKNDQDQWVQLADYKGKKLVIYFYPKDDTPGCTREGIDFSRNKEAFENLGAEVLGVSKDSVASHQSFCKKHQLSIGLLSDIDGKMVEAYQVWQEKKLYGKVSMGIVRTTFLVNESGYIIKIWHNVKVDGHVEAVLAELKNIL